MFYFPTLRAMMNARLPRQPIESFGHPRKAYVYLLLCKHGRAKIGQTTNPSVRVRELCAYKYYKAVTCIAIVGPTKQWRELETRLLTALQPFLAGKPFMNILYDDFVLSDEIATATRECFSRDCFPDALERLERVVQSPPDYQI